MIGTVAGSNKPETEPNNHLEDTCMNATHFRKFTWAAVPFLMASICGASAQVYTINSAVVSPRVFQDVPGAALTTTTTVANYPSIPSMISFNEQNVSAPSGFANRDVWQFSNDGSSAYQINNGDYFNASFDLTLTGDPISPRKEAGIIFSTASNGDIQFIVNTDGHEVVQFGGISFYSFSANGIVSYDSGDTINLGMSYFMDGNGKNALQFFANGNASPVYEFGPSAGSGALDIGDGSKLGGYFQIVNDPANPSNAGTAVFSNIEIVAVPEPGTLAILGLGIAAFVWRRRQG